jgi:hypothetical protein
VVIIAIAFAGIQECFENTVRHTQAHYCQSKPQPPMKYHVTRIPNPFEMKRKHAIPPTLFLAIVNNIPTEPRGPELKQI